MKSPSLTLAAIFFLGGVTAITAAAQEKDPNVRLVADKGVTYKLQTGWSWATEAASASKASATALPGASSSEA